MFESESLKGRDYIGETHDIMDKIATSPKGVGKVLGKTARELMETLEEDRQKISTTTDTDYQKLRLHMHATNNALQNALTDIDHHYHDKITNPNFKSRRNVVRYMQKELEKTFSPHDAAVHAALNTVYDAIGRDTLNAPVGGEILKVGDDEIKDPRMSRLHVMGIRMQQQIDAILANKKAQDALLLIFKKFRFHPSIRSAKPVRILLDITGGGGGGDGETDDGSEKNKLSPPTLDTLGPFTSDAFKVTGSIADYDPSKSYALEITLTKNGALSHATLPATNYTIDTSTGKFEINLDIFREGIMPGQFSVEVNTSVGTEKSLPTTKSYEYSPTDDPLEITKSKVNHKNQIATITGKTRYSGALNFWIQSVGGGGYTRITPQKITGTTSRTAEFKLASSGRHTIMACAGKPAADWKDVVSAKIGNVEYIPQGGKLAITKPGPGEKIIGDIANFEGTAENDDILEMKIYDGWATTSPKMSVSNITTDSTGIWKVPNLTGFGFNNFRSKIAKVQIGPKNNFSKAITTAYELEEKDYVVFNNLTNGEQVTDEIFKVEGGGVIGENKKGHLRVLKGGTELEKIPFDCDERLGGRSTMVTALKGENPGTYVLEATIGSATKRITIEYKPDRTLTTFSKPPYGKVVGTDFEVGGSMKPNKDYILYEIISGTPKQIDRSKSTNTGEWSYNIVGAAAVKHKYKVVPLKSDGSEETDTNKIAEKEITVAYAQINKIDKITREGFEIEFAGIPNQVAEVFIKPSSGGTDRSVYKQIWTSGDLVIDKQNLQPGEKYMVTVKHNGEELSREIEIPDKQKATIDIPADNAFVHNPFKLEGRMRPNEDYIIKYTDSSGSGDLATGRSDATTGKWEHEIVRAKPGEVTYQVIPYEADGTTEIPARASVEKNLEVGFAQINEIKEIDNKKFTVDFSGVEGQVVEILLKPSDGGAESSVYKKMLDAPTKDLKVTGLDLDGGKKYIVTVKHNGEEISREIEIEDTQKAVIDKPGDNAFVSNPFTLEGRMRPDEDFFVQRWNTGTSNWDNIATGRSESSGAWTHEIVRADPGNVRYRVAPLDASGTIISGRESVPKNLEVGLININSITIINTSQFDLVMEGVEGKQAKVLLKKADGSDTEHEVHAEVLSGGAPYSLSVVNLNLEAGMKYIVTVDHNGEQVSRQIEVPAAAGGLEITGPDPSVVIDKGTMVLEGKGVAGRAMEVQVDGGGWIPTTVGPDKKRQFPINDLERGIITVEARMQDAAGTGREDTITRQYQCEYDPVSDLTVIDPEKCATEFVRLEGEGIPTRDIEVIVPMIGGGAYRTLETTVGGDRKWHVNLPMSEIPRGIFEVEIIMSGPPQQVIERNYVNEFFSPVTITEPNANVVGITASGRRATRYRVTRGRRLIRDGALPLGGTATAGQNVDVEAFIDGESIYSGSVTATNEGTWQLPIANLRPGQLRIVAKIGDREVVRNLRCEYSSVLDRGTGMPLISPRNKTVTHPTTKIKGSCDRPGMEGMRAYRTNESGQRELIGTSELRRGFGRRFKNTFTRNFGRRNFTIPVDGLNEGANRIEVVPYKTGSDGAAVEGPIAVTNISYDPDAILNNPVRFTEPAEGATITENPITVKGEGKPGSRVELYSKKRAGMRQKKPIRIQVPESGVWEQTISRPHARTSYTLYAREVSLDDRGRVERAGKRTSVSFKVKLPYDQKSGRQKLRSKNPNKSSGSSGSSSESGGSSSSGSGSSGSGGSSSSTGGGITGWLNKKWTGFRDFFNGTVGRDYAAPHMNKFGKETKEKVVKLRDDTVGFDAIVDGGKKAA